MKNDVVFITCYYQRELYHRLDAYNKFFEAFCCSEGSEQERYANILLSLMSGETEIYDLR